MKIRYYLIPNITLAPHPSPSVVLLSKPNQSRRQISDETSSFSSTTTHIILMNGKEETIWKMLILLLNTKKEIKEFILNDCKLISSLSVGAATGISWNLENYTWKGFLYERLSKWVKYESMTPKAETGDWERNRQV